jgi:hypothetical protein
VRDLGALNVCFIARHSVSTDSSANLSCAGQCACLDDSRVELRVVGQSPQPPQIPSCESEFLGFMSCLLPTQRCESRSSRVLVGRYRFRILAERPAYTEGAESMYVRNDGKHLSKQTASRPRRRRASYSNLTFHTLPRLFIAEARIMLQLTFGGYIFYSICLNIQRYTAQQLEK